MKYVICTLGILLISTAATLAGGSKQGWDDDYAKALAEAAKDKKMVLLDFTGSDWCGWCIKLDEEVFSKSDFKRFARENLVLVELDYPHDKRLPKKTQEQNAELKKKFSVSGYPTIVLVDAEGKEQARWPGFKATLLEELKAKVPPSASAAAEKK
jgi:thioredoxin-related protein